jgi:hypothetical protein
MDLLVKRELLLPLSTSTSEVVVPSPQILAQLTVISCLLTRPLLTKFYLFLEQTKVASKKNTGMHNSKNHPLASSIVGGKNPGTSHMDQREKKIFEIYSSSNPKAGSSAASQSN